MRPYAHELCHHLLTATAIATIAALALVGAAGGYTTTYPSLSAFQVVNDYSGGAYHFLVFTINKLGTAFAGAHVELWINSSTYPGAAIAVAQGTTGASGIVALSVAIPEGTYFETLQVTGGGYMMSRGGLPLQNPGQSTSLAGVIVNPVFLGFWNTAPAVSVLALAPGQGAPVGYEVRYLVAQNETNPSLVHDENAMNLLGNLSAFQDNFPWNVAVENASGSSVVFSIFAPNGTAIASTYLQASELVPTGVSPAAGSALGFLLIGQLLVSLLALMLGYSTYGKDRSLHTIDSVLWRPVTRTGLFLVRFCSILIALAAGLALMLGVIEVWTLFSLHSAFPISVLVALFGVLLAEGAAFAGLVVLASHLIRSRGGMVGATVGIFLFFWVVSNIIVDIVGLGLQVRSDQYSQFLVNVSYFNPAELLTPTAIAIGGGGSSGLTVSTPILIVTLAVWSFVPLVGALFLVRKRD